MARNRRSQSAPPQARVLLPLILALALRLLFILPALTDPQRLSNISDATEYVHLAGDLGSAYLDSGSESFEVGLKRTPGYPVFLGVVFAISNGSEAWSIFIQVLFSVATVWLTYQLARRMFNERVAILSAFALAVSPISVLYAGYFQPEALFTFLLVAAALLWVRVLAEPSWWLAGAAGLTWGVAVLMRPIGLYLLFLVVPVTLALGSQPLRQRIIVCGMIVFGFAIPTGGWIVRNTVATGVPTISTIVGTNFLEYRAAGAYAAEEGLTRIEARDLLLSELQAQNDRELNPAERSDLKRSYGTQILLQHPVGTIKTMIRGAALMMLGPGRSPLYLRLGKADPHVADGRMEQTLAGLGYVMLGIIYAAALVGAVAMWRHRRRELVVLLTIIVYFLVISSGPEAWARFRFPMMPFIAILAGFGSERVLRLLGSED